MYYDSVRELHHNTIKSMLRIHVRQPRGIVFFEIGVFGEMSKCHEAGYGLWHQITFILSTAYIL